MRIIGYKFLDENLVLIHIINEYGRVRVYPAKKESNRLKRLATIISKIYSENKERIIFEPLDEFNVSFGVL